MLDEPDTGGAVDAFDQQIDLAVLTEAADIFLLDLVEVVDGELLRRLRGRTEDITLGRAPVESLQTRSVDRPADGAAANAAERALGAGNLGRDDGIRA